MYRGIVKWNGNHYESGEVVSGSKMKIEDGKTYIFDDEPIEDFPYYGDAMNVWVEVNDDVEECEVK